MAWKRILSLLALGSAIAACNSNEEHLSKVEVRALRTPTSIDWCDRLAWYDDGVCDDFCPLPDSDCDVPQRTCGATGDASCAPGEFCDYTLAEQCGAADHLGTCKPIPEACAEIYGPVCGCNGETFGNACEANAAGVAVLHEGVCDPVACPALACDLTCVLKKDASGCDLCECQTERVCGGLAGLTCDATEFCDYAPSDLCGAADQLGICQPRPEACAQIFEPVCGCDFVTYGNACEAASAGVSVFSVGECGT